MAEDKTEPESCLVCQKRMDIIEKGTIKQPDGLLSPFIKYQCSKCKSKMTVRNLV